MSQYPPQPPQGPWQPSGPLSPQDPRKLQEPPQWQGPPPQPNTSYPQHSGPQWSPQQPFYTQPNNYQHPTPGMMPPPLKPPQPPRKKLSRRTWIIIAVVMLILVIASAANAAKGTDTPTAAAPTATDAPIIVNSQATDTPIPATATAIPTAKPTQTNSSVIIPTHGTPHLGGPISDFYGKYGTPNDHTSGHSYGSSYHWFRDGASNADGLIVWNLTHFPQVDSIDVAPVNNQVWTSTIAEAACTIYNPIDAHQIKRIPIAAASTVFAGFDVVYVSTMLANEFAADDFSDGNGNTVQRGSFDIMYLYKSDGSHIDSCSILPGEQQTTE